MPEFKFETSSKNSGTRDQAGPSAPPSAMSATPATQNDRGCEIVPRLPREIKVDVTKCHACHAKVPRRHARPSGPKRATQCHECHACHAKRPWMWVCATPATWNQGGCHQVPRLPRKSAAIVPRLPREIKVDVTKCHACYAKVPRHHAQPSGPKRATLWMWDCATPATWNQGGCHQVPRLPRTVPRRHAQPSRPKRATQCHECHACHAKRPWMWDCATPATWNQGGCHQVPRLPRKMPRHHARPSGPKRATQCHECHACHAKRSWMWVCATLALQNDGRWDMWKMVCDKVVCERWCVTKVGVKDGVWQSCMTKLYVKDGVWQSCTGDQNRPKRATRASLVP